MREEINKKELPKRKKRHIITAGVLAATLGVTSMTLHKWVETRLHPKDLKAWSEMYNNLKAYKKKMDESGGKWGAAERLSLNAKIKFAEKKVFELSGKKFKISKNIGESF
jgi:hypothetical protein